MCEDESECIQSKIQILLDAFKKCKYFKGIFKKTYMLRNPIPRAFCIAKLVPISRIEIERRWRNRQYQSFEMYVLIN